MREEKEGGLSPQLVAAVQSVVDYLWDAEREDFLGRPDEEPDGHIFQSLVKLSDWLTGDENNEVIA